MCNQISGSTLVIVLITRDLSPYKWGKKVSCKVSLYFNSRWSGHHCSSTASKSTNSCSSLTPVWRRRFKTLTQPIPRWRISHSTVCAGIIHLCASVFWLHNLYLNIQWKCVIPNKKVLTAVLLFFFFMVNTYLYTPILELKNREKEPTLSCELCGKVDFAYNFKRSKRFCSTVCAKRYQEYIYSVNPDNQKVWLFYCS